MASPIEVRWDERAQRIVCRLPLTQPTGKVRVRRGREVVAARREPLRPDDVLEWQIAYRDEAGRPVELGQMLRLARQGGLVGEERWQAWREWVEAQDEFCDERFAIFEEPTDQEFHGFRLRWRRGPVLSQETSGGETVEIEIRPRQRAVGFQAMVYLLVPLRNCHPEDLIGRPARPKEHAEWSPSLEVLELLVRAFALASRTHREDMIRILEA